MMMIESSSGIPENMKEAKLPRRDLVVLPLLSLLTVVVCLLASEVVARHYFVAFRVDSCRVGDDTVGFRYRPNCTSHLKAGEGRWVTNQFNDCGYRTKESCGPKPRGAVRIALLGSSMSEGIFVGYDDTFAARTARQLTMELGRPVEVQNLSGERCFPVCAFNRVDEALALKPDLLMLAFSPFDLEHLDPAEISNRHEPFLVHPPSATEPTSINQNALERLWTLFGDSSAAFAAQHYLFQNTSTYVGIYLHHGTHADYLRVPLSPAWEKRLEGFDVLLVEIANKATAANVPVVLVELPSFAQVALLKMQNNHEGVDPHVIGDRLKQIASLHGIQFIGTLDAFKLGPDANKDFFVVDTHMSAEGNDVISRALVEQLIKGQDEALLDHNRTQQAALKESR
jgi:hypothetical protein